MNVLRGNNGPRYRAAARPDEAYTHFAVRPLTPVIGAEIEDLDLNTLSDAAFDELFHALAAYQVLFFSDQPLTPGQRRMIWVRLVHGFSCAKHCRT